jgi:hypothetical protein
MSRKGLPRWDRYATRPNENVSRTRTPRTPATAPSSCPKLDLLSKYTVKCIHYIIDNFLLPHGQWQVIFVVAKMPMCKVAQI